MNDQTQTDDLAPADDAPEAQAGRNETQLPVADKVPAEDTPAEPTALDALTRDPAAMVEAVLFASDAPLTTGKIADVTTLAASAIKKAIDELNTRYDERQTSFYIKSIAGGFQMQTRPEFDAVLARLLADRKDSKLSQAAMETLAIIAYRQPILRANVEAIRGVACGEVLRGLMEKQLVKIVGRAEILGRPMLYGTTRKFLELFGLSSLDDLPNSEDLRSKAYDPNNPPQPQTEAGDAQDATPAEEQPTTDQGATTEQE